jgi:group I intron endonuclease
MYGLIYLITNAENGKQYVGQTTYPLKVRWQHHLRSAQSGLLCALHCAIRRYGAKTFKVEQIDVANSLEELNKKEVQYVASFHTLSPNGYNLTTGGERCEVSKETRKKQSDSQRRCMASREARQHISGALTKPCCRRGHLYDNTNTYIIPSTGHRKCWTCYYLQSGRKLPERLQQYVHGTPSQDT